VRRIQLALDFLHQYANRHCLRLHGVGNGHPFELPPLKNPIDLGVPFFFIPLMSLALATLGPHETASAVGMLNFLRTLSGAFATSLVTTSWEDRTTLNHAKMVALADSDNNFRTLLESSGASADAVLQIIDRLIASHSVMLSTNQVMAAIGIAFIIASSAIWLARKPRPVADTSAVH
jgi:DHA2 family multidrug resistance protein